MDIPAQPDYARVADCFHEIDDNAALLPNVSAVDIGEHILLEIRQLRLMHEWMNERTNERINEQMNE